MQWIHQVTVVRYTKPNLQNSSFCIFLGIVHRQTPTLICCFIIMYSVKTIWHKIRTKMFLVVLAINSKVSNYNLNLLVMRKLLHIKMYTFFKFYLLLLFFYFLIIFVKVYDNIYLLYSVI